MNHFIPRNNPTVHKKQSVRSLTAVCIERQQAIADNAAARHALTKTAENERAIALRHAIKAIEHPVQRQHIVRPRKVRAPRFVSNA